MVSGSRSFEPTCRHMLMEDISRCSEILTTQCQHEGYDPDEVCSNWPALLNCGRLKGAVVDDPKDGIIAFGASVFLKRTVPHPIGPLVGRRLTKAAFARSSLIATQDDIARGNAGSGVDIFILHSGLWEVAGSVQEAYVKAQLLAAFMELHRGYKVASLLVEAYGSEQRLLYESTSFRELDNYSSFSGWNLLPVPSNSPRPCLLGAARDDVMRLNTSVLLPMFVYRRPRCGFTDIERCLLREALNGGTDEELAVGLNLSVSAVKKRWMNIFEKAEDCLPEVAELRDSSELPVVRGRQRRHVLLRVLRARPEELTPYPKKVDLAS